MGLLSILLTTAIILFSAGYYFFGTGGKEISLSNGPIEMPIVSEVEKGKAIIDTARDVKSLVEQQSADTMKELEGNGEVSKTQDNLKKTESVSETKNSSSVAIENRLMSTGFSVPAKVRSIDTIVIHSSYDLNGSDPYSVSGVIKEYTDYGVSAHYLIDRKGTIFRLVEDKNIAYHAGVSKVPDGRKNVNDFSLGIEMMNTEKGQFTNAQYSAVNDLITSLKKQYKIKFVVGHNDIAPDRKTDPWNFDWKKLNH